MSEKQRIRRYFLLLKRTSDTILKEDRKKAELLGRLLRDLNQLDSDENDEIEAFLLDFMEDEEGLAQKLFDRFADGFSDDDDDDDGDDDDDNDDDDDDDDDDDVQDDNDDEDNHKRILQEYEQYANLTMAEKVKKFRDIFEEMDQENDFDQVFDDVRDRVDKEMRRQRHAKISYKIEKLKDRGERASRKLYSVLKKLFTDEQTEEHKKLNKDVSDKDPPQLQTVPTFREHLDNVIEQFHEETEDKVIELRNSIDSQIQELWNKFPDSQLGVNSVGSAVYGSGYPEGKYDDIIDRENEESLRQARIAMEKARETITLHQQTVAKVKIQETKHFFEDLEQGERKYESKYDTYDSEYNSSSIRANDYKILEGKYDAPEQERKYESKYDTDTQEQKEGGYESKYDTGTKQSPSVTMSSDSKTLADKIESIVNERLKEGNLDYNETNLLGRLKYSLAELRRTNNPRSESLFASKFQSILRRDGEELRSILSPQTVSNLIQDVQQVTGIDVVQSTVKIQPKQIPNLPNSSVSAPNKPSVPAKSNGSSGPIGGGAPDNIPGGAPDNIPEGAPDMTPGQFNPPSGSVKWGNRIFTAEEVALSNEVSQGAQLAGTVTSAVNFLFKGIDWITWMANKDKRKQTRKDVAEVVRQTVDYLHNYQTGWYAALGVDPSTRYVKESGHPVDRPVIIDTAQQKIAKMRKILGVPFKYSDSSKQEAHYDDPMWYYFQ